MKHISLSNFHLFFSILCGKAVAINQKFAQYEHLLARLNRLYGIFFCVYTNLLMCIENNSDKLRKVLLIVNQLRDLLIFTRRRESSHNSLVEDKGIDRVKNCKQ